MNLTVKALSPEWIDDYFDFFDHRAFTDNPPWGGCYCIGFQMTKEDEKVQLIDRVAELGGGEENSMRALREVVVRQITAGALRGYLAYADGLSIGWCNANDRASYPADDLNGAHLHVDAPGRTKAVVCFEIAPAYRGKGVATALLRRVLSDAKAEGYAAVEGFPCEHDGRCEWDYTGPRRLYEKLGFAAIHKPDGGVVMRKELDG